MNAGAARLTPQPALTFGRPPTCPTLGAIATRTRL